MNLVVDLADINLGAVKLVAVEVIGAKYMLWHDSLKRLAELGYIGIMWAWRETWIGEPIGPTMSRSHMHQNTD
jgi:hypothetical protein